jgi:ubiquinone/menaquinone biosynthesis C-methylase UbiE
MPAIPCPPGSDPPSGFLTLDADPNQVVPTMKSLPHITLADVQAVYTGPEGDLWELMMGEQIHVGGLESSRDLADRAGIQPDTTGVDLCCCTGAGMRFLLRFRQVARMIGVDATPRVIELGRQRTRQQGLTDRLEFIQTDVCATGLPANSADFVWGEDAWCYVADKARLIAEAVRLVKPGGVIAFTDWLEGPNPLSDEEAHRFMSFMKFPSLATLIDCRRFFEERGCSIEALEDTGRFPHCMNLYLDMLTRQLAYDALRILGFDRALFEALGTELGFARDLVKAGKVIQALIIARKPGSSNDPSWPTR